MAENEIGKKAQIYKLLAAGAPPQEVKKQVKCSTTLVWKHAKKLELEGHLARVKKYPAIWKRQKENEHAICEIAKIKQVKKLKISCELCGITDRRILHIHHRDLNHKNSVIENLQVLCANCHTRLHWEIKHAAIPDDPKTVVETPNENGESNDLG